VENASAAADDPAALVAVEVEVDQLVGDGHALALPSRAAVRGVEHEAVHDCVAAAQRADDPAALLAREADAVEFGRRAAEGLHEEAGRELPGLPAVLGRENLVDGEEVAVFTVAEVDVVHVLVRPDVLPRPGAPAVFGVQD
jgi:hypothetical protein